MQRRPYLEHISWDFLWNFYANLSGEVLADQPLAPLELQSYLDDVASEEMTFGEALSHLRKMHTMHCFPGLNGQVFCKVAELIMNTYGEFAGASIDKEKLLRERVIRYVGNLTTDPDEHTRIEEAFGDLGVMN